MANDNLYWQRIGERQDASTAQAREASPVTVQVPKTGQQVVLERSFCQAASAHSMSVDALPAVQLMLVSDALYARVETGVIAAGLVFVLAFRFAVLRLQAWVEVLVVALFLVSEVLLELYSPVLAAGFLKAGVAGIALVAAWTAMVAAWRRIGGRR